MQIVAFAVIAIVAIVSAVSMVFSRNAVHSALFLVINLFCVAVLYLSLSAEFLAVVQVIVYAGAIMVLFLFVITLLNPTQTETPDRLRNQGAIAGVLAVALLAVSGFAILASSAVARLPATPPDITYGDNVQAVGSLLYGQYLFPFEATTLLLLVAIVGATVLAKRRL
jgi:NADH-quinone oxidoreductase subunit J